ncbi:MAG: hypothetical protein COZ49_00295 [Candidatus Yonathbacteria bacterium CG_4_10_14_3_um_filter_47_65]|uniref:DNA replication/recombination mediator RecO N-terminal domain-containing protein n=2 Tax=Parcubacteria group TaxID=1794811 RepID=A0A2M8D7J5_9BACT|nr:MAG: hypothetical protein AUJ44_01905 [Candidatus Nomurabacteria bacterium CG1_02_47_685]PIP04160.1 MAG: hypothetical protein COX54_00480 [Candidatus Yonathbacteria bacterium CG23_combo_of_CG06-09_8_20_14_all_46_18]PIQ31825.1 MAG: hypothetical protein COW61_02975 [Candidatus Yonathbacteria bacterium CG17_big_fil_post_rev_8_21_14_2_50_46_19]PIX56769.1 MAG: hypothetical protein COZ49_00295 [Candidatus Yonathbacteria bacterium CG_4_10_14_3_um_filter_47_65]PIY57603.1 MAG: hypothetical protein CO
MSYHIYRSPAIILTYFDIGESSRLLRLFTKEFGIVFARAQGVRELRSKQRYNLRSLSLINIDMVRGRGSWRIISAETRRSFSSIMGDEKKREAIAAPLLLLKKMFVGETADSGLFDDVICGMAFLEKGIFLKEELRDFEVLFVSKILYHLGYWEAHASDRELFSGDSWSIDAFASMRPLRRELVARINQAISAAHL